MLQYNITTFEVSVCFALLFVAFVLSRTNSVDWNVVCGTGEPNRRGKRNIDVLISPPQIKVAKREEEKKGLSYLEC
jgi:hypothetical protein